MKSDSPDKSLGIPSFGIHIEPDEKEHMHQLTEVAEPIKGIFLELVGLFMGDLYTRGIPKEHG
jgi:hypothetical protein